MEDGLHFFCKISVNTHRVIHMLGCLESLMLYLSAKIEQHSYYELRASSHRSQVT